MNFTFGIITDETGQHRLSRILTSVVQARYHLETQPLYWDSFPQIEFLSVGGKEQTLRMYVNGIGDPRSVTAKMSSAISSVQIKHIPFKDDPNEPGWITKKKNLITENAKFPNIVYMHDYLELDENWFIWTIREACRGYDVAMSRIANSDGTRYRDWTLYPHEHTQRYRKEAGLAPDENLLPYDEADLQKWMYISGAYWMATKKVMQQCPLDEKLHWGQGEDVHWSRLVQRQGFKFKMSCSTVKIFEKTKPVLFREVPPEKLEKLKLLYKRLS